MKFIHKNIIAVDNITEVNEITKILYERNERYIVSFTGTRFHIEANQKVLNEISKQTN